MPGTLEDSRFKTASRNQERKAVVCELNVYIQEKMAEILDRLSWKKRSTLRIK